MIRRIHIKGYKSLRDVEVTLEPLSVLFGPNSAGKSNFLDALQLLSSLAMGRTVKEAFSPPYRGKPLESFSFGEQGIPGLLKQDSASFSIEVDVELPDSIVEAVGQRISEMKREKDSEPSTERKAKKKRESSILERRLRYRVEIEIRPKSGFLLVADEYLAALNRDGIPTGKRNPFLERVGGRLHLRMEGQAHPIYHEQYLDHTILSTPLYPPHYPHMIAMREYLSGWLFFYLEPRERMRQANPVKEVRHIGPMGEDLAAYLNTLKTLDERQFKAVERSLNQLVPSIQGIRLEVTSLGEVDLHLVENGIPIPARVLSEGTLRILGLLALSGAKQPPSLVGFEEPENGIHPRRIQLVAELLKSRIFGGNTQIIVTSHSPILPDIIEPKYLFVCRKEKGQTTITPFTRWGPLFQEQEIEEAFREPVDIPSVSERIMRGDFDA